MTIEGGGKGLDIVVVNYKTPDDLQRFLTSIQQNVPERHNLFVANVESTVEDSVTAKSFQPHYQIDFPDNVGYAHAVNHCVSLGDSPIIGIFNADVVINRPIGPLLAEIQRNTNWGCVGPRQVDDRGRLTHAGIFGDNVNPQHRGWLQPDVGQYDDIRDDAITLSGAALFTRRSAWNEMRNCPVFTKQFPDAEGAFLPTPHYYEETGFIYHLRHHGYLAVYYGPTRVVHQWHKASPVGGWADRQMPVSREIFREFCREHKILCD